LVNQGATIRILPIKNEKSVDPSSVKPAVDEEVIIVNQGVSDKVRV